MKKKIIEINNIKFEYQKNQKVFKDISLNIFEGETLGIIGSNGAGKSTLLKLIVGLNEFDFGKVLIDGIDLNKKTIKEVREKIGYTFQESDNQLFMTTVYEDVAFGPRNYGLNEKQVRKVSEKALNDVGALHLSNRPAYKLSGGEKRLITIATVLSMNPEIIILDEPTTGLDPKGRRSIIQLLKKLKQTKIIATHDMDLALEICDRIVVMHKGDIYDKGLPLDIFNNDELLKKSNLEKPFSIQGCPICS